MLPIVLTVLAVAFVAAIYGLFRLVKGLEERADEMDEQAAAERDAQPERVELGEPLGPDGIAYLAAHKFVPSGVPRNPVNARKRAYAPVTGDELEPRRLAEHMLHAVIVSFVRDGRLQLKVGEQDPSFMPPFPHKRWVLRLVRKKRLDGCPLAEALDVALDLAEQRTAKKGADVADGIAIDELIEDMLKVMRQEMSFW
ncbi:MAG TPA: hypothetical protein QGH10_24500, partial [Armatimonadota bacterium]|nr:hypothetical protein [Armatimonadota bacterium]